MTGVAASLELSEAAGPTEPPLLEETIGANLARTVARWGDREALVECATGRRWTYAELDRDGDEVARGLLAAGLAKGDRLGLWSPNCAEWTLVQYAAAKIGVILVNLNPAYRTHELVYALNQSGLRMLICAAVFKTSDYPEMVAQVRPECPALEQVVVIGEPSWQELLAGGSSVDPARVREVAATLRPEEPINIQYTSGTTGFPK